MVLHRRSPSSSASIPGSREGSQRRRVSGASVENTVSSKRVPNTSKSNPGSYDGDETPTSGEAESPLTTKRRVWQHLKKMCDASKARAHALKENLANKTHNLFKKNQGKKLKEENLIDFDTNTNNKSTLPLIPEYLMEEEPSVPKKKAVNKSFDSSNTNVASGVEHENKNPHRESCKQKTGPSLEKTNSCKKLKDVEFNPHTTKYFNTSDMSLESLEHLAMRLEQLQKTDDACVIDEDRKPKHKKSGVSFSVPKRTMINVSRGTSPISIFSAKPNQASNSRAQQVYRLMVDKTTPPSMAQCMPIETAPNTNETHTKPDYYVDPVTVHHLPRTVDLNQQHLPLCMPTTLLKHPSQHSHASGKYNPTSLDASPNTPTTVPPKGPPVKDGAKDFETKDKTAICNTEKELYSTYPSTIPHNSQILDKSLSTMNHQVINEIPINLLKAPHKPIDSLPHSENKIDGNDQGITENYERVLPPSTLNQNEEGLKRDFMYFQRERDVFQAEKHLLPNHQPLGNYHLYKPRVLPSYSGPPMLSPLLRSRLLPPSPSILGSTMSSLLFPHHPSTYYPFPFMSPWFTPFAPNANTFHDQGSMFPHKSKAETTDRQLRSMSTQTDKDTFIMNYQQQKAADIGTVVNSKPSCTKATQTESLENISPLQNKKSPAQLSLHDVVKCCHRATSTHFTESCGTQTNLEEECPYKLSSPSNSESSLKQPEMIYQWLATSSRDNRVDQRRSTRERVSLTQKAVHLDFIKSRREVSTCLLERGSAHLKTTPFPSSANSMSKQNLAREAHLPVVHERRVADVTSTRNQNIMFTRKDRSSSSWTSLSNMADFQNASTMAIKSSRGIDGNSYLDKTISPTSNEEHIVFIDYESLPEIKSSEDLKPVNIFQELAQKDDQATQTTKCSRKQKIKLFFRRKLSNLSSTSE